MTEHSKPKQNELLLKHVNAVALMPAKGSRRISVLGRKLFNILLLRAQENGEQEEYFAKLHEIVTDLDSASKNSAPLKKVLMELMTTTVEWQSPSDGDIETWDACNLLSGAGITKDKVTGSTTVRWRFDSQVRSQLLYPDRYAQLSLQYITQLTTHSSVALYEICARYVADTMRKTAREHWHWWRPVLTGVASTSSHIEYRFFKRDILKKAIAEINIVTNLRVKLVEFKENDNKTISDIQFEVRLKEVDRVIEIKPLADVLAGDLETIGRAINYGVKQAEIERLVKNYGSKLLIRALDELAKRIDMPTDKIGKVLKPGSWLKSRLVKLSAAEVDNPPSASSVISKSEIKKQKDIWIAEWHRRQRVLLISGYHESNEHEKAEITQAFSVHLSQISQPVILKQFLKSGWDHRMVRETFVQYIGPKMIGESWDTPSTEDLLAIAAESAA